MTHRPRIEIADVGSVTVSRGQDLPPLGFHDTQNSEHEIQVRSARFQSRDIPSALVTATRTRRKLETSKANADANPFSEFPLFSVYPAHLEAKHKEREKSNEYPCEPKTDEGKRKMRIVLGRMRGTWSEVRLAGSGA